MTAPSIEGADPVGGLPAPLPFDVTAALPTGTTVLEASAGTGKTYTIGALVARYVAEGVDLSTVLVVTFGRAASQELRERVRAQLVTAERALAHPETAAASKDALISFLAKGEPAEIATRRRRIATALADFDAATIATTHQFCDQVLTQLGVAGDTDPGAVFLEDLSEIADEVSRDVYLRRFALTPSDHALLDYDKVAAGIGRRVVANPHTRLEPVDPSNRPDVATRIAFAADVRKTVEERKRSLNVLGYDDLLTRVAEVLRTPGNMAADRMRARWQVVLVDEFQDTDPVQWEVLQRAFDGHATLTLVGDPKQAIYAFRGGDVVTYLNASATAQAHHTLAQNWRADAPLVRALQVLFDGAALGDPQIVVRPIEAVTPHSRLVGAPSTEPVRLRQVPGSWFPRKPPLVGDLRPLICADLAADVARLLRSKATFDGAPLRPGQIAVLVPTRRHSEQVHRALSAAGVPAVLAGSGNVFKTAAADDWLVLLEALDSPHRAGKVRAAALTPFLGATPTEIDVRGDAATDEYAATIRSWADTVARRGIAALLELATAAGLGERLLSQVHGERLLTDIRHIGELLHEVGVTRRYGVTGLADWLRHERAEAAKDDAYEQTRRLDNDAAAVQIVTMHGSKGLQYPVVYLPFAFEKGSDSTNLGNGDLLTHHNDQGERVLDVRGRNAFGYHKPKSSYDREIAGEQLRLLYVSLTRAQSQVVLWWAPSSVTAGAAFHRLVFGRDGSPAIPDMLAATDDVAATARFRQLEGLGGLSLESAERAPAAAEMSNGSATTARLSVGQFDRELDLAWRRTSYSALGAAVEYAPHPGERPGAAGEAGVASEPEQSERDDEQLPDDAPPAAQESAGVNAMVSPMATMPTGVTFGTLVHAVLEHTDPGAADLGAELRERAAEQMASRPGMGDPAALADALTAVMRTPLGPLAANRTLAEIPRADRLAELDFELPLAGGDRFRRGGPAVSAPPRVRAGAGRRQPVPESDPEPLLLGEPRLGQLAPLLSRHLAPTDPLAGFAATLALPAMATQPLRGYLTGSLDLVVRLPGPRYVVADYKTNWLGPFDDGPLTSWHYRPAALAQVMAGSTYPLQALLYCVALHRFLRWRQPGYDPASHLGGVLYLYVRGMCGPTTPVIDGQTCGVFSWQPPAALVTELSDLLAGSR